MDNIRKMIKIASYINCIIGALIINLTFYGVVLLALGLILYFFSSQEDDKLIENKNYFLIISIISIFINIISAIITFIVYDEIKKYIKINGKNAPPKVIYKIDPESKKINMLLRLGVGMIIVSGILFTTTSWDVLAPLTKAILLLFLATVFLSLSIFTGRHLKLYKTSYIYWLLGIIFYILTIVGLLYFSVFGVYLTYGGAGKYLAYSFTFLVITGLSIVTYLKYPKKYFLTIIYSCISLSLFNLLRQIGLSAILSLTIISLISLVINIFIAKDKELFKFSKLLSVVQIAFICSMITTSNSLLILGSSIINLININILKIRDNNNNENIFYIILSYATILIGVIPVDVLSDVNPLIIMLTASLYTLLINSNIISTTKSQKTFNYILFTIISFITFIISFDYLVITSVIIAIAYMIINEITKIGLFGTEKLSFAKFSEPIAIICLIVALQNYFFKEISLNYIISFTAIINCILYLINPTQKEKTLYYIFAAILSFFATLINIDTKDIIVSLLSIITTLFLFTKLYIKDETKKIVIIPYLLLLTSIYIPFVATNILDINIIIVSVIFLSLIGLVALLLQNSNINKISLFYAVLPILSVINQSNLDILISLILTDIFYLYCILLVDILFIKEKTARNLFTIIAVSFSILDVFFTADVYCGIFVGIIGLIIILISYSKEELSPLFKYGIILTILNIIYQLQDLWGLIPFWLYLLLGGLLLIGFVTYKEITKNNSKTE